MWRILSEDRRNRERETEMRNLDSQAFRSRSGSTYTEEARITHKSREQSKTPPNAPVPSARSAGEPTLRELC